MTPENYQAAMNAPIQQQNSDNSDQGIEMYPDSWETIRGVILYGLAIIGAVALCAVAGFASSAYF